MKIHLAPFALRGHFCQYFVGGVAKIKSVNATAATRTFWRNCAVAGVALTFSCLLVKNDTPVHKNYHSGQGIQDLDDILKLCGCIQRIGRKIEALWVHPAN